MTLSERYENAEHFSKLTALFAGDAWILVGPGVEFVGEEYDTFEEAIRRVDELYFEEREAEYAEMDCS